MEENQTSGGLPLVTWGECSFFPLHPLFADRAASSPCGLRHDVGAPCLNSTTTAKPQRDATPGGLPARLPPASVERFP